MTKKSSPEAEPESWGPITIAGETVAPGTFVRTELPVARFVTGQWLSVPVEVLHGAGPGPAVWLSGAIHGDELDGVEITRQVIAELKPSELSGTLYAIPIVNVFGFVAESRYLPDRRDLNRSFPGRADGSMAARLAHLFMTEIVDRCQWGLDFHCGSGDRANYPQVRADLDDPQTLALATAFGAPLLIHNRPPDGSLRRASIDRGVRTLVYEGGEAGRFTRPAIEMGVDGALRALKHLGLIRSAPRARQKGIRVASTHWVRASRSGICRLDVELGETVRKGARIGEITEVLGGESSRVKSGTGGIVIGRRVAPLVYQGEALVHLAKPE